MLAWLVATPSLCRRVQYISIKSSENINYSTVEASTCAWRPNQGNYLTKVSPSTTSLVTTASGQNLGLETVVLCCGIWKCAETGNQISDKILGTTMRTQTVTELTTGMMMTMMVTGFPMMMRNIIMTMMRNATERIWREWSQCRPS